MMANDNKDPRMADHLSNERTFLSWIRTSLGIIAFGFVIERFGLFIKQMGLILGKTNMQVSSLSHGLSEIVGIFIVAFGTLMSLLAYINFKTVEKHIRQGTGAYRPSGRIYAVLMISIIVTGTLLLIYLVQNIFPAH